MHSRTKHRLSAGLMSFENLHVCGRRLRICMISPFYFTSGSPWYPHYILHNINHTISWLYLHIKVGSMFFIPMIGRLNPFSSSHVPKISQNQVWYSPMFVLCLSPVRSMASHMNSGPIESRRAGPTHPWRRRFWIGLWRRKSLGCARNGGFSPRNMGLWATTMLEEWKNMWLNYILTTIIFEQHNHQFNYHSTIDWGWLW